MAKRRDNLDDRYPNAPLTEVACEVRFPGEIAVESAREIFWNKIRSQYPVIKVPHAQPGVAPAVQHYRYQCEGGTCSVAVALNSLALSETNYTTHRPLLKEFERLHGLFATCYPKIRKANRVGWRYVNAIPFVRQSGLAPLSQFLKLQCQPVKSLPTGLRNAHLSVEIPSPEGLATIRLQTVHDNCDKTREAFLLDLDFAIEKPDMNFAEVGVHMRRAHMLNRRVFEDLITDEYRAYLRGDAL